MLAFKILYGVAWKFFFFIFSYSYG